LELYQCPLNLLNNLILIVEGKKKEWIVTPTIFTKCLGLELISGIIDQSGEILKYMPEFRDLIENSLVKIIKKNFETTNDYIMGNTILHIIPLPIILSTPIVLPMPYAVCFYPYI